MLNSLKGCNCFSYMINSIISITHKNNEQLQSKKKSRKLRKTTKNFQESSKNPSENSPTQQNNQKNAQQISKLSSKVRVSKKNESLKNSCIVEQVQTQNLNEGLPQTQRSLVNGQKSFCEPSESNENDLPTEKSEIIMNDIGKSVNHNQNIFMNRSQDENDEKFQNIYEKIAYLRSLGFYYEYQVKKISSDQIFKAYILKDFDILLKMWNLEQQEGIEKYEQIYEREKIHIKNLIELQKANCRHLLKLIDYELKPPTIDINNGRKLCPGSIAIVFQNIQEKLQDFLENNILDKSDKKRIIHQIVTCINDIHENKMVLKNFSLKNFYIDKFQNVKFLSIEVQSFDFSEQKIESIEQDDLFYLSPEKLGCNGQQTMRDSYFHSGFSVISDFDRNESTQEQQNLWKLGIIIAKILTGKFIFCQANHDLQKKQIIQTLTEKEGQIGKLPDLFLSKVKELTQGEIQIISSLLKIEPNLRKSCKQLLESKYLQNLLEENE